jgi:hypothetical protein
VIDVVRQSSGSRTGNRKNATRSVMKGWGDRTLSATYQR